MYRRVIAFLKSEIIAIRNGKAFVFLVCLFLASFLWILNALQKRYTDRISIPVQYINKPSAKELTSKLPDRLELTVDAVGYTLLQYKLNIAVSPLLVDVNELTNNYLENNFSTKYSISTTKHRDEFAKQISSEMTITSIRPDTITFKISHVVEKLIKVYPQLSLNFAKEYIQLNQAQVEPESVLIKGPEEILDTLKFIYTKPIEAKNVSQSFSKKTWLIIPSELKSELTQVSVKIAVEQYTEAKFEVPIQVNSQPEGMTIKTFPSQVKVLCRVGISEYNKLSSSSFKAVIDYAGHSQQSKLPVKLLNLSENIISIDYSPKEVEFIIERK
jgi:YbbR domain-containing protein